jgi:hypothetical protein
MPSKKKTPTEVEASVIVSPAPTAEPRKARVPRAASASVRKGTSHKGTGTPAARQSARNISTKRVSKPRSRASNAALAPAGETVHPVTPERNEISLLAYSYWEARGCQGGSPEEDWYRAEHEIQKRRTGTPSHR